MFDCVFHSDTSTTTTSRHRIDCSAPSLAIVVVSGGQERVLNVSKLFEFHHLSLPCQWPSRCHGGLRRFSNSIITLQCLWSPAQVELEIDACFEEYFNVTQRLNSRGRRRNCAEDHVFRLSPSSSLKTSTFPVCALHSSSGNYTSKLCGFWTDNWANWILLGFSVLCWAVLVSAGQNWAVQGCTGLFTWLYQMQTGDSGDWGDTGIPGDQGGQMICIQ